MIADPECPASHDGADRFGNWRIDQISPMVLRRRGNGRGTRESKPISSPPRARIARCSYASFCSSTFITAGSRGKLRGSPITNIVFPSSSKAGPIAS